jgi:BASS family bile acid:Na+ symporter
MVELSPLVRFLSYLFLCSVMLSIGLDVSWRQILDAFRDSSLLGRALVANLVLVPLLGLGLVQLFPMSPDIAAGMLILAAAPGAPFAVQFTSKAKDSVAFAAALLFVLTVVALVATPSIAGLLIHADTPPTLPVWRVVRGAILYLVLPLFGGFVLQRWGGSLARALRKPATICAAVCFPAVTVLTIEMKSAATRTIGVSALVALFLLVVGAMFLGWFMGGPDTGTRRVLATSTGMRNVMVALLIAVTSFPNSDVDLAVLAFSALMVPPNLVFTMYRNRKAKRLAA